MKKTATLALLTQAAVFSITQMPEAEELLQPLQMRAELFMFCCWGLAVGGIWYIELEGFQRDLLY